MRSGVYLLAINDLLIYSVILFKMTEDRKDRDEKKKLIKEELIVLRCLSLELKDELHCIEEAERLENEANKPNKVEEKRYVYIIWSTCKNSAHNTVSSTIHTSYDTLKEANDNLPPHYRSGHREVTFNVEKVLVGHEKGDDIRVGYYSD